MNKSMGLWGCLVLLVCSRASYAEAERPYLGLQLDPAPLPELVTKHLGLEAGQGVRISNITVGSPADKAGLERDDIVVAFQGKVVASPEQLVEAVGKSEIGARASLDVIHLGQRKSLQLELAPLSEGSKMKYPPEPEVVTTWRPGKVFKIGPDGRDWMEVPFDKLPDSQVDVNKFFQEIHTYHHATDGEEYSITIEGNPEDKDARIIVGADGKKYTTTVGEIDKLPEKYRGPAREAVENASRNVKKDIRIERRFRLPEPPSPEVYRKYFDALPRPDMERWSEQKDRMLEKMQEQMERLQQRMQELEQRHREMFDKMLEKKEKKQDQTEESTSLEPGQQKAI